ncbi:ribosome-binding factor A, partial [Oleiphilus sp. HI0043]
MAQDFKRTDRIADQMQRDLAELLRSSMKDPRVGMVTVNQVVVAKDLGFADVYVTLLTVDDLDADAAEVKST